MVHKNFRNRRTRKFHTVIIQCSKALPRFHQQQFINLIDVMTNLLRNVLFKQSQIVHTVLRNHMCTNIPIIPNINGNSSSVSTGSDEAIDWKTEIKCLQDLDSRSVLEPPSSTELYPSPPLQPTFNLAAYVNNSETLQQLLKLGVELSKIERKGGLAQFILKLDFEKDIKNHIQFLHDVCGLPMDSFGSVITKNPLIFRENLIDLDTRVNYLKSKRFQFDEISRIVEVNPFWLMFRTQRIDRRLGYFQKKFELTGQEVRQLSVKQPRLITYHMESIERNTFSIREEFGFTKDEARILIYQTPKILMMNQDHLADRLDYIHNKMNISHSQIIQFSEILQCRKHRLRQRHEFLKLIGKAQYDPSKDLYIPLKRVVEGTDMEFVTDVAKTSYATFDQFLRQL